MQRIKGAKYPRFNGPVVFIGKRNDRRIENCTHVVYKPKREAGRETHNYLRLAENGILHGQQVARACITLKEKGFTPDIIVCHPGWGEALYVKDIFPNAPLLNYFEFYYRSHGADVGFDSEFPVNDPADVCRVRLKNIKQDGNSKVLLYAYGAYKHSISPSFSASRFCLVDRGITFAIAHIRGGGDLGDVWHEEGKKKLKKNTFLDYIACANHLIEQRYTYKGGLCFYGGSAGGLTGGAVANMAPDLFFSMLLLVPFVDTMTTMLNDKLPLTPAEWELWGNPIKSKEYFEYILSYAPYNNLEKKDYPSMLITTSLFDNRVLYSEPVKYIAKLRDVKTDNNTQLLKCKMEAAGHGGMSGRDNAITELAEEYSFILKSAKILN